MITRALLATTLALLAPPHGHAARLRGDRVLGIGDQNASIFVDPRFRWLGVGQARLAVAWDVTSSPADFVSTAGWLLAARAAGVQPLVAFDRDWKHRHELPSVTDYARAVTTFMRDFPWVRQYQPWNEEDAGGEPTAGDPALAARYFNWLQRHCQGCTVLAADLLDGPAMISWLRRFLKVAHKPRLWGLHPYYEGAYGGDGKLEDMLRLVHGRVWFTETGAPVWRYVLLRRRFDAPGQRSQTQELSRELSLARLSSRITRVYVYQWRNPGTLAQSRARLALHEPVRDTWDSGLLRPGCSTRPAFALLARAVGLNPAGAPPAAPTADDLACVAPAVAPTA